MRIIQSSHLYFSEGSSDKEYHAEILSVPGGNIVNFRYGRRGGTLTSGTKTAGPVEFAEAKKIYDKLIKEKTSKGYTCAATGILQNAGISTDTDADTETRVTPQAPTYQSSDESGLKTGFMPQLLNPISEAEAMRLIEDGHWAAQEKMDGERRAAHADSHSVIGINRRGLQVPLPLTIANELKAIGLQHGAIRVDGEIIGEVLYVFDLHVYQGNAVHHTPWLERMRLAETALRNCKHLKTVPIALNSAQKYQLWHKVKSAHGEGIVFKRSNSPAVAGRPNSGGDWLKFKFTERATVQVGSITPGKRSVGMNLFDDPGDAIYVGNITIPVNHEIPRLNALIDVEYLYAYRGGSIYQPVYRGQRTDLDLSACTLSQLKYKPEGRAE